MKKFITPILSLILALALVGAYGYMLNDIDAHVAAAGVSASQAETLSARDAASRSTEAFLEDTAEEQAALAHFVVSESGRSRTDRHDRRRCACRQDHVIDLGHHGRR